MHAQYHSECQSRQFAGKGAGDLSSLVSRLTEAELSLDKGIASKA